MRASQRGWTRTLWVCAFLISTLGVAFGQGSKQNSEFDAIEERDRDNPRARDEWFMRGRTAPNGESAAALRFRAYQQKMQLRKQLLAARAVTAVPHVAFPFGWTPLGPAPLASNAGTGQDYGWVSGRATAVAIDPADATGNTVYLGGAHGGVWRSDNAGPLSLNAANVVWTPVLDYESTLAVGAIAIQPSGNTDTSKSVILVGTGEPNSSADSYYGLGILRSTDGGASWTLIPSDATGTHSFAGLGFSKIAFSTSNPQLVVAAAAAAAQGYALGLEAPGSVNRGIYYSQDGGASWRYAAIKDGSSTVSPGSVTSVVYNASAAKFFAAVRYHGIYSSTDGINWARLADANQPGSGLTSSNCPATTATTPLCPIYRAELTVVPGRNEMYTWVVSLDSRGSEVDGGIWQNLSGGTAAWRQIADPDITNCGDSGGCGVQQGAYNLEIAALPNGQTTDLYAGAINVYKCRAMNPSSPSCTWLNLTHVYGCLSIANVHPDQHHLAGVIASGKELMYFANDGGVYRALDGYTGLTTGTCGNHNQFDDLNGSLGSMTQFVSFSLHPTDMNTLLGGTQDNGSPATAAATTSSSWSNVQAGDGGYNAISPANATDWFAAYPDIPSGNLSINYCGAGINCSTTQFQQVVSSGQVGNDDGAFYFPYILDPQASNEIIVGTCRVWRGGPATSTGGTYTTLSNNFDTGGSGTCTGGEINQVHSLAAGGPKDTNNLSKVIYAGTDGLGFATNPSGGRVFVTTNAGTSVMADRTGSINPGQFPVSSIVIDPADATGQTAFVAIMGFHVGHVFKTTNAGVSWTAFSGNLPDAPADTLVIDPQTATVYVGTDVGVFASSTASANWTEVGPAASALNSGYLPNVPVTALRLFASGGKKLLRASTYGRGIWQFDLLASTTPDYMISITNPTQTIFPTQTATFNGKLIAGNGYASAVTLSCTAGTTAAPSTCTPSPASGVPTGAGAAFTVSAGGTAQDYLFNVHGVGTDASTLTHDAAVTMHVVDFGLGAPSPASVSVQQGSTAQGITFAVTAAGSFTGTVTLSCPSSGMPAGVTCSFTPAATVTTFPTTVTLLFTTTLSTPLGTTPITISANTAGAPAAKTQSVSLTVTTPAPDYQLTITNSPQSATADQTPATFNGILTALGGYGSAVNLTCGAAAPPTCTITPSTVTPTVAGASFTVTVKSGVAQAYNFNINGSGTDAAHVSHTAQATFNSLFTLSLSNSNGTQSVVAGQVATYGLTVTPIGATTFPLAVNFSCSGLPAGATCSNPSIAMGASGVQTVSLAISTSGSGRAAIRPSASKRGSSAPFFAWMTVVGIVLGGVIRRPARGTAPRVVVIMVLCVVGAIEISCGGGSSGGGGGGGGSVVVSVNPRTASKFPTQTQQFTAGVSGSSNTQVTWQVNGATGGSPAAGTIDNTGLYTAPGAVPNPATVTVTAVAQADVTKSGAAIVTIQSPTPTGTYAVTITATVGSVTQTTTAALVVQ